MKNKILIILPILTVLSSCGNLTSISDGPRNDELIATALNEVNFLNYSIQARQHNEEVGDFYSVATITPLDLSFKAKKTQYLITTELSYYYFDKVGDHYNIYYRDKLSVNPLYLGNSFYENYKLDESIQNFPNNKTIFEYYQVFNITSLREEHFTYNTNLNGWYILKETSHDYVIRNFFKLDAQKNTIKKFELQVVKNKVNSIVYEIEGENDEVIENELFYTYPIDYLQDSQFSLINDIEIQEIELTDVPGDENVNDLDEENSEVTLFADPNPLVHKINFSIYDDVNTFKDNQFESIAIYENYDYTAEENTPIAEIVAEARNSITDRSITLDRKLTTNRRYLIRIGVSRENEKGVAIKDYYDYSFIYK